MTENLTYREGFRAHAQGKKLQDNPYLGDKAAPLEVTSWPNSWKALAWSNGWKARDEHMRDRDEVLAELGF